MNFNKQTNKKKKERERKRGKKRNKEKEKNIRNEEMQKKFRLYIHKISFS